MNVICSIYIIIGSFIPMASNSFPVIGVYFITEIQYDYFEKYAEMQSSNIEASVHFQFYISEEKW